MNINGNNFNQIPIPQFPTITPQAVQPFGGFGQNNIIGNLASNILGSLLGNMGGLGSVPGMTGFSGGFNPSILSMFNGSLSGFFNPIALPSFPQINTQPTDTQPAEQPVEAETKPVITKPDISESYPAELKPKVEEAKVQLAKKLGVPVDSIKLSSFKERRSAYLLTFDVQGKKHRVNISRINGDISIDSKPDAHLITGEPHYPRRLKAKIDEARANLAKKLGVSVDAVKLLNVERIKADYGPLMIYVRPGYVLTFEASGKQYKENIYPETFVKPPVDDTLHITPKPNIDRSSSD